MTYTWYIMILHMASLHATAVFLWNGFFVSSSLIQEIKAAEVQPGWTFPPAFGDEKGFGVEPSNVRSSEAAGMAGNSPVDLKPSRFRLQYQNISKYWIPSDSSMNILRTSWSTCSQQNNMDFGHWPCPSRHADASRLPIRRRWATTCAFNSLLPLKRNTPPRWTVMLKVYFKSWEVISGLDWEHWACIYLSLCWYCDKVLPYDTGHQRVPLLTCITLHMSLDMIDLLLVVGPWRWMSIWLLEMPRFWNFQKFA